MQFQWVQVSMYGIQLCQVILVAIVNVILILLFSHFSHQLVCCRGSEGRDTLLLALTFAETCHLGSELEPF